MAFPSARGSVPSWRRQVHSMWSEDPERLFPGRHHSGLLSPDKKARWDPSDYFHECPRWGIGEFVGVPDRDMDEGCRSREVIADLPPLREDWEWPQVPGWPVPTTAVVFYFCNLERALEVLTFPTFSDSYPIASQRECFNLKKIIALQLNNIH